MLKVPDHQVAGHHAGVGKLGPLIDNSGRFYKPLQTDERGDKEVAFYTSFSSNTRIPDHIRRFFPVFHGTQMLEASDGSGLHPHLVLQDLVSSRLHPSIIDVKIGSRTWYPEASDDYVQKCLPKDRETTSLSLGFRISGLQVYGSKEAGYWKPEKKLVLKFSMEDVRLVLRKFVSSNTFSGSDLEPDCCFASTVYGGSAGILAQLLELKAWFEDQTIYHFNSCSVLMMYEKEAILKGGSSDAEVKLIDFAHVREGGGVIDHNFLGGLCSLIKFISEILTNPNECRTKDYVLDSEKDHLSPDNDDDNLQDVCPTAPASLPSSSTIFVNGYTCKNPTNITASDFKTSRLNHAGDTDNFLRSSTTIITAADFPGLNTLGLSVARTDLAVDGFVLPHSHPRASETIFISKGVVVAGFIDTKNKLFQKVLNEGDVFVFPRGLLHFCWNSGYELASVFSVLNSQNPGLVNIAGAMFETDDHDDSNDVMNKLRKRLFSSFQLLTA